MILKTSISLIALALTLQPALAQSTRDTAQSSSNTIKHGVEHVRSSDNYAPQAMKSSKDKLLNKKNTPALKVSAKPSKLTNKKSLKTSSLIAEPSTNAEGEVEIMSAAIEGCSETVFTSLMGVEFLAALRDNGRDCIDTLFNDRPETLALGAYSVANFATVINEIKAKVLAYDGTDPDGYLSAMYYWLKAYSYYDYRRFVTSDSQASMEEAVNALYENSHFFDITAENAAVVKSATGIFKNAEIGERFIHITRDILQRYNESYENTSNWGSAIVPLLWQSLQSCASNASCRAKEHNLSLVNAMVTFVNNNLTWLDKPDNDYHLFNIGYQLANLYRGKGEAHFSAIETELALHISTILTNHGPLPTDTARTLYLAVFESVNYNRECSTFNICDSKDDIINSVLADRITCPSGTLFIWAQDMNEEQLAWACSSLGDHETYFHTTLQTNQVPVTPDDNDKLHMIIFNDKAEWVTYGGALFNVSTSNGGTYREGDPSKPGDQATFYAYEHVAERPIFDIWNLRHEYIHYLEGRFISKGDFGDSDGAGRTVWFGEGIAEYISLRNCNDGAIAEAQTGQYELSTIFSNEYGVGQTRIYDWGYLSNRYMFERQNSSFFEMLALFKAGDFQTYREQMVDPWVDNKTFDDDFSQWLTTVDSKECTIDLTRPESPIEPVNIDHIQGSDQVGIDACALGRPQEDNNIKAGEAICLSDTSNGNQIQLALGVPSGLENVSLEVSLRHGSGNGDLLQRWNYRPNSEEYDQVSNSNTNNETITVTPVISGWNYIHVVANNEFSGATLLARYIQNDGVVVDDSVLVNGETKTVSGSTAEEVVFTLNVPDNATSLSFDTSGGSGDADMYIKFGAEPTTSDYDCRPYKGGNVEHCSISNIQVGTYYVMLRGYDNFTDVNVVAHFETQDDTGSDTEPGLQNNVSELVSGIVEGESVYMMTVPEGATNLIFSTSGGTGDVDMHVKFGSEATKADYDCRPWKVGSNETCNITNVQAGTYYIMLLGYSDFTDVNLVGSYSITP